MVIRTLLSLWAIIRRCFVIPSNRLDGYLDMSLVSGLDIRVFNNIIWPRSNLMVWAEHPLINSHTSLFLSDCLFYCSFG
jgi:hypothetical protein